MAEKAKRSLSKKEENIVNNLETYIKNPVESGVVLKGLSSTQKGMDIYNTVKSIKDLNPFGFLLGKVLQKVTKRKKNYK